jgi:7-cyano-7-deazaguanine synthase
MPRRAIVLLSGGLDSATTLAVARSLGFMPVALSFRYGQRHRGEIEAAATVAQQQGVLDHRIVEIDLRSVGGSALTDDIPVPAGRSDEEVARGIPITYVPARNTIFLAYALALGEVLGATDIFIGVNAVDYSGYPDCRPEFIAAFERLANLATRTGVEGTARFKIHAPLLDLAKAEIIRLGLIMGVDFGLTRSCYAPDAQGRGCGACDACRLRLKGFREAGVIDPAPYAPVPKP